jgi:isoquinoline 1-oxidoreductase beta subunit
MKAKRTKKSSDDIIAGYQALVTKPGIVALTRGDTHLVSWLKQRRYFASIRIAILAHATMEPMVTLMQFKDGQCEVWNGNQLHSVDQFALSATWKY